MKAQALRREKAARRCYPQASVLDLKYPSSRTPPITRPLAPRRNLRTLVSRVGCIGLFGRDVTSMKRGARHARDPPPARQPGELNYARFGTRNCFLS